MNFGISIFVAITFTISGANSAFAQTSSYKKENKKFRALVVETVYQYSVEDYANPTLISLVAQPQAKSQPENVIVDMLSSMVKKNFDWNFALWSPESRIEMARRDRLDGDTKEKWLERWRAYEGLTFHLTRRAEYSKYVLIEFKAYRQLELVITDTMALERVSGEWYLTQALAKDSILRHWSGQQSRVQQLPESWNLKSN